MQWNLITDSEIQHLTVPDRILAYAHAYLSAASSLCNQMNRNSETATWPHSAVVLMLSAHAVELFIKGSILKRKPNAEIEHHRIDDLAAEYKATFPEDIYNWDIPFRCDYSAFTESEAAILKKKTPFPSMLYRYPVGKGWSDWKGVFGFEPSTYETSLAALERDFRRLEEKQITILSIAT